MNINVRLGEHCCARPRAAYRVKRRQIQPIVVATAAAAQLPQQQPRKAYLHRSFFIPPSNAPNWTVCQVCRVCQWMFTSHAFSVDLCRLKAFKALLLVMVVSESGSENATRQAAQNGETPLSHINSGTARSGKMIAGSSL